MKSRRFTPIAVAVGAVALLAACTSGPADSGDSTPSSLTLWSRGANETINKALVDAWNTTHSTKVTLLPIPDAQYQQKLAAANAAGNPPDVATLDVATIPQMVRGGLLADITDQSKKLPYFDKLAQSYIDYSTLDGKIYALPENIDASTLFWNKDLFTKAGLDPAKPPTNFAELKADAAAISKLGGDIKGFYFSGQCLGCNNYTMSPLMWASKGDYVDKTGKKATLTSSGVEDTLSLYQELWRNGDVPQTAKADTGANWVSAFGSGNIGIEFLGAFAIAQMRADYPSVNYGITTLPGVDGGASSYTGGDVIGIPAKSKHQAAAWEFVKWSLTPAAQVEVYAKSGSLVARSDLVENKYATDPNVVAENKAALIGRLPVYYPNADQINSATGPFSIAFQSIVFDGADPASTLKSANDKLQQLLDQG
jgi:multiple sugar transport system substrate-binding protein